MPEAVSRTEVAEPARLTLSRRVGRARWVWIALGLCLMALLAATATMDDDEYVLELGPYTLPAHGGHGTVAQTPLGTTLERDGWVRGLTYEVVDEEGNEIPARLLHHVNLIAPERRELFSPIMLRIGAAGAETRPYSLPFFLGYRIRRGDSLLVTAMLHNQTDRDYQGVKLRLRLDFTDANSLVRPWSVQPMYVDVTPPSGAHSYDLPPGRSTMSWEGRPAIPVRLLAAGGHLHRYATALRFEDRTTGELIWEARPELGEDGVVESMPIKYFLPLGVALFPDHEYRLTAEYENPTGEVLPNGGMGALGGIVMPSSGSAWPAAARSDSVYQHDVWMTTGPGAPHRRQGGHHH
jgi:hypothetical protein